MKLKTKELKRQARESLTGHYGVPMAAFILIQLISFVANSPFQLPVQSRPNIFQIVIFLLASVLISLLASILHCGLIHIHLNRSRQKKCRTIDIFYFFTKRPDRILLTELMLTGLFLVTAIPAVGISLYAFLMDTPLFYLLAAVVWLVTFSALTILSLQYHLTRYLLVEQPDERPVNIMRNSRKLMSGNKGRAFYIRLSFLGMSLLCLFSLGIGFLWLDPYINQTQVKFYQNITGEI